MREHSVAIVAVDKTVYRFRFIYLDWDSEQTGYRETICQVYQQGPKGDFIREGGSLCAPMDNYRKAFGRKQAFGRAISHRLPKRDRSELWASYFKAFPQDRA